MYTLGVFFPPFFTPPPRDVLILSPVFLEPGKFFFSHPSGFPTSPLARSHTHSTVVTVFLFSSSPSPPPLPSPRPVATPFPAAAASALVFHRSLYMYTIHLRAVVTAALPVLYIITHTPAVLGGFHSLPPPVSRRTGGKKIYQRLLAGSPCADENKNRHTHNLHNMYNSPIRQRTSLYAGYDVYRYRRYTV